MKNYTITKEQILELHESNSPETRTQIAKMFPDAFKKELELNKWYKSGTGMLFQFSGKYSREKDSGSFGFNRVGIWAENIGVALDGYTNYTEATKDEVKQSLKNEVIKRFGEDWQTAKIEKCLVHGVSRYNCIVVLTANEIWNKNGCIYKNGVFAEPLKYKVISIEKAEKILSKKYGKKVTIK